MGRLCDGGEKLTAGHRRTQEPPVILLMVAFRSIALNPVEAHLCERPGDWTWSSYGGIAGTAASSSFVEAAPVLACFGGTPELARSRLRAFVEDS